MRYFVLATDYDGTLATDGHVHDVTKDALKRLRTSGRKLILITGRQLDDLQRAFPELDLFDYVVAENGALRVLSCFTAGLKAALEEMNLSPQNVVAVGDAENDYAFMNISGCSVAVANALPALKEKVDIVTEGSRGDGVVELINKLIASD